MSGREATMASIAENDGKINQSCYGTDLEA